MRDEGSASIPKALPAYCHVPMMWRLVQVEWLIAPLFFGLFAVMPSNTKPGGSWRFIPVVLMLLLGIALPLCGMFISIRMIRRVHALLDENDGVVCPRCWYPLKALIGTADRCPECTTEIRPDVIRAMWLQTRFERERRTQPWRHLAWGYENTDAAKGLSRSPDVVVRQDTGIET